MYFRFFFEIKQKKKKKEEKFKAVSVAVIQEERSNNAFSFVWNTEKCICRHIGCSHQEETEISKMVES